MKVKTVIISVVVSAALVAGAGYGAYYALQGKKSPVQVVPVSNVNTGGYWGISDSIYGSVTSQISQNISLDEEYTISEIFVKVGDKVQEGTPLFSYDMTLQELELEMEQLNLQVYELTMTKLEKDLEKLKRTPATASLERDGFFMTTASDEAAVIEEMEVLDASGETGQETFEEVGGEDAPESPDSGSDSNGGDSTAASGSGAEESGGQQISGGGSEQSGGQQTSDGGDELVQIEDIETMEASEEDQARLTILDEVASYEQVVATIDSLFRAYGEELRSEEVEMVAEAIADAVSYYLKHLAEEQVATVQDEAGNPAEQKTYVIRASVREALGGEKTEELIRYSEQLEEYQIRCTEMMLEEASGLEGAQLAEAVDEIEAFADLLPSEARQEVENMDQLETLRERAEQAGDSQPEGAAGEGTDAESETADDGAVSNETAGEGSQQQNGDETQPENPGGGTETPEENTELPGESLQTPEESTEVPGESSQTPEESTEVPGESSQAPEINTEGQSESTESETQQSYTIEVQEPGSANVASAQPGEIVVLHTDDSITGTEFAGWTAQTDGAELDIAVLENLDPTQTDTSFVMPAMNVKLIPNYRIIPSEIEGFITSYEEFAAKAMAEGAAQSEDYLTLLGNAMDFYQQWLSEVSPEILDETVGTASMEQYQLKAVVQEYLTAQNRENEIEKLQESYKEICKTYVKVMVTSLDPQALTREAWNAASRAYENLGAAWQAELEEAWAQEEAARLEQTVQTETEVQTEGQEGPKETESEEGQTASGAVVLSLAELLQAYDVILTIQELDMTKMEELLRLDLAAAQEKYFALTQAQQAVVWNASVLLDALESYGMLEPETEAAGDDFGDMGDFGFDDSSESYTAEELKAMIEDKEQEIKECGLDIREAELAVKQCQRVVDGKVVKSTMEGTVVSIGDLDGNSEDDYFAKVTNEEGLYAKGSMNELSLETIKVGDRISGMMMDTGVSFTAVIKEISSYPSADNESFYYGSGSENSNASYYPFYALIEDTTDIEEGEAEIQLSETMSSSDDAIYLEKYFIRSDNTGKSYVYMQGEDGKLVKQYVTTGKLLYGYALEIVEGLSLDDRIAFPYGSDVFEGAATKEVDMLTYM